MVAVLMIGTPIAVWLLLRWLTPRPAPRPRPAAPLPPAAVTSGLVTVDEARAMLDLPTLTADLDALLKASFERTSDEIRDLPEIQREELLS